MVMAPTICINVNCSPSNIPQTTATIGIRYVTEEENTGVDIWTKEVKITLAIAVPNKDKITT